MHGLKQTLLHTGQLDVLLVATLTLHLGGDASDDDDGIGSFHLLSQR